MKSEFLLISDYFPLCYDLIECRNSFPENPTTTSLSAGELVRWAAEQHLTELQTLDLLIKNAFEGHLCHLNGISVTKLAEQGTIRIEMEGDNSCTELACDFFHHLHLYADSVEIAWKQAVTLNPGFAGTDIQSGIYFILTNQLFRLPVSFLKAFDMHPLNTMSTRQRSQMRTQYLLHSTALSHAAQRAFIETVDDRYAEKFKQIILKLCSKETVLQQLCTKLDYANDPSITTEEELEQKYFEFLVATNVTKFEKREPMLNPEMNEQAEAHDFKELLKSQIKKLYKAISKNCSEVHNQLDGHEHFPHLSNYFIAASSVYNAFYHDLGSLMLQHSRLMLLLAKVINNRVVNQLPVHFIDFTGKVPGDQAELREEDMVICRNNLQRSLEVLRMTHITDYKIKYLKDEEMSKIHSGFLVRQLDFIENRICEVMNEIKQVMQDKARNNTNT